MRRIYSTSRKCTQIHEKQIFIDCVRHNMTQTYSICDVRQVHLIQFFFRTVRNARRKNAAKRMPSRSSQFQRLLQYCYSAFFLVHFFYVCLYTDCNISLCFPRCTGFATEIPFHRRQEKTHEFENAQKITG